MSHRATVWVEVLPERSNWGSVSGVRIGRVFKTPPKDGDARFVKVTLDIDESWVEPSFRLRIGGES